jgi:hypothetical protein
MTIEPPGGLLLVYECSNMLSICIWERWNVGWQSFASKVGLHPSTLAHLSRIASNFEK